MLLLCIPGKPATTGKKGEPEGKLWASAAPPRTTTTHLILQTPEKQQLDVPPPPPRRVSDCLQDGLTMYPGLVLPSVLKYSIVPHKYI